MTENELNLINDNIETKFIKIVLNFYNNVIESNNNNIEFNNLNTLIIEDKKFKFINKLIHQALAVYNPKENKIELYSRLSDEILYHELFHALTSGFNQVAFNEGVTELLCEKYLDKKIKTDYYPELLYARVLSEIVGIDKLEKAYLSSDIDLIYDELLKYYKEDDIDKLLQLIEENFYKHANDKFVDAEEMFRINEEILTMFKVVYYNKFKTLNNFEKFEIEYYNIVKKLYFEIKLRVVNQDTFIM